MQLKRREDTCKRCGMNEMQWRFFYCVPFLLLFYRDSFIASAEEGAVKGYNMKVLPALGYKLFCCCHHSSTLNVPLF